MLFSGAGRRLRGRPARGEVLRDAQRRVRDRPVRHREGDLCVPGALRVHLVLVCQAPVIQTAGPGRRQVQQRVTDRVQPGEVVGAERKRGLRGPSTDMAVPTFCERDGDEVSDTYSPAKIAPGKRSTCGHSNG